MKEFKIGDKVKLNQPMPIQMNKQIEYRKYYDVRMIDTMEHEKKNIQIIAIDGVKGFFDSYFFDLYIENENRDFTLDELVFIQGHLTWVRENFEDKLRNEPYLTKNTEVMVRKINTLEEINKKISELFETY